MKSIIRNFIAKRVAGRSDDGIMITLSDPRKVDFQAAMLEDLLMRNGIDPNAIKSEEQLKMLLNQISKNEASRIRNTDVSGIRTVERGKVFDMEGKEIPRGSKIMGGKEVPGTSDRDRVRNEMKEKYGFTDERLDEIENTPVDEEMADRLIAETDLPPPGSRGGKDDIAAPVQSQEETLRNMTEAEIKANLEKQNKDSVQRILERKNREDVYSLEDYDTTNMSEIKKEIIRTETKLGNLNPNSPDFRERAKPLIDKITALQKKLREDKADGGRIGLKSGSILESLGFTPEHSAAVADMDEDFSGSQFDYAAASTKDMVDRASNPVTAAISAAGNVVGRPFYDAVDAAKEFSKKGYQGEFSFTPQGAIDFGKNLVSLGKEFVNQKPLTMMAGAAKGGLEGVIDRFNTQETPIDPTSKNLFTQVGYEEDPYAGIAGQTALLDPFTVIGGLIKVGKGAKASALAKNFFKQKAKEKIGKEIYDKIQKKINTPKYPTTPPIITGGGGSDSGGGPPGTTTTTKSSSKSTGGSNPYSGGSGGLHSGYADGGRIGFFMGSKFPKGLGALREMLQYYGKKSDAVKNPSDILKMVNPNKVKQMLEDPSIYSKFNVKEGIGAPETLRNIIKQKEADRIEMVEEMLGSARNIRKADEDAMKYKKDMIEDMMKKGIDRETAEGMAETITKMAEDAGLGKFKDTPKLTKEGVLELENILKNMKTGGKDKRSLNADGGRIGYKDGPKMTRRTFLKYLAGFASIPIIGKIVKPLKTVKGVKNVPIIKTSDVKGKPEWFDQLVNKVIIEGDDVSKKFATKDREIVHMKEIDDETVVRVTQDLDEDAIRVEYENPENMYGDPVQLQFKKGRADEGTKGTPPDEFQTTESIPVARADGPDDYAIEIDEGGGQSISDLVSDVSKLKQYATGQKPTLKEIVQTKKRKDKARAISEGDYEAETDFVINRQGEPINEYPEPDDFASGGIARMLGE